jgi:hypothetical protein
MIWREKRVPLGILGVFLLANAVFFFTYRVQYENRLQALDADKHGAEQRLANLRAERAKTDQQVAGYRKAQSELSMIYNDKWATEPERLTALINEVKRLEQASQLVGRAHAFGKSEKDAKDTKDVKLAPGLGTDVVTISFTVQGTYQQVRRLINLLELSDQFVIIDAISLSGNDAGPPAPGAQLAGGPPPPAAGPLTMTLRLKTIFRATAPPPAPGQANQQL